MEKWKKTALAAGGTAVTTAAGLIAYRRSGRLPRKEATANALYMAVLDDEICRRELADQIVFPSKRETLQYKYDLFLEQNRKRSRRDIQQEIIRLEYRLNSLNKRAGEI